MVCAGFSQKIFSPVASLTLLAIAATAYPTLSLAQSPEGQNTAPVRLDATRVTQLDGAYTLGAGDRIQIDIFNVPEYSGENGQQQVLADGSLNLPLVGRVSVQGMTLTEAGSALTSRYSRFLKRPIITVGLLQARPLDVAIAGEVIRPGSYTMSLGGTEGGTKFPTLTRALQTAGGITQAADLGQIQVRRGQRSGPDQVASVNLREFFRTGNLSQDLGLRDGDTIIVPTATAVSPEDASFLADTTVAADPSRPLNIAVVGEVERPGPYTVTVEARTGQAGEVGEAVGIGSAGLGGGGSAEVSAGASGGRTTVTRAIQTAGGIKPQANIRQIEVRRPTRSGAPQVINVDLFRLLQQGDITQDVTLAQGDTVFVPTANAALSATDRDLVSRASVSPATMQVNVVGEVKEPGLVQLQPNSPLNEAVLAAGGFDKQRARQSTVQLVRLNPDGTVSKRTLPVDFASGINSENNPILQNDDVVIVGRSALAVASDTVSTILAPVGAVFRIFGF